MEKFKNLIKKIKEFLVVNISEVFLVLGLILVDYATYRINLTASIYVTGFILILFGIFFAISSRNEVKK